jgi:hypothetical protein
VKKVDAAMNAGPHRWKEELWNKKELSQVKVLKDWVPT